MADSTAMARHEHKVTFPVGDVPKDAAWYDTTRRVFFDEYHIELTRQELLLRQAARRNSKKRDRNLARGKKLSKQRSAAPPPPGPIRC